MKYFKFVLVLGFVSNSAFAYSSSYSSSSSGIPVAVYGESRSVNPNALNRFGAFDTGVSNTWTSVDDYKDIRRNYDFVLSVSPHRWNMSVMDVSFGPYFRFQVPASATNKGYSSTGAINVEKKTTLSGYLLGGELRAEAGLLLGFKVILNFGAGAGMEKINQTIVAGTATSTLKASAFTTEFLGSGGLAYSFGFLDLEARVGYSRQHSSIFVVDSVDGSLYSVAEGNAIQVKGNGKIEDLVVDRSGMFYSLGVSMAF